MNIDFNNRRPPTVKFDLEQFIFALSDTVDLAGIDEIQHSKRVGYMAMKCGEILGFDEKKQRRLLHLGMLHDCGVSSTEERVHLAEEMEWENSHIHCQKGASRMQYFPPLQTFADAIAFHHTRWESLKDTNLDEETRLEANLLYLIDRADYLGQTFPGKIWLTKKDLVRNKICKFSGIYFNEDLIQVFLQASANEAFWCGLQPIMLNGFIEQQKQRSHPIIISLKELKRVAELFAQIVDAKSTYTAEHSYGVANLATYLAELSGLDKQKQAKIEITGLLHDLGKLQVPDFILENPGPLGTKELAHMRHHSYTTYRILENITGLEDIAEWAGNHHEALDGSGYPFRKTAEELSIESRIVTVSDIFQALAQKRPYRDADSLSNILAFLKNNSDKGRLDRDIVATVCDNGDTCYEAALK